MKQSKPETDWEIRSSASCPDEAVARSVWPRSSRTVLKTAMKSGSSSTARIFISILDPRSSTHVAASFAKTLSIQNNTCESCPKLGGTWLNAGRIRSWLAGCPGGADLSAEGHRIEGLGDHLERAPVPQVGGDGVLRLGGHEDHRNVGAVLSRPDRLPQLRARHFGHHDIEEQEVRIYRVDHLERR